MVDVILCTKIVTCEGLAMQLRVKGFDTRSFNSDLKFAYTDTRSNYAAVIGISVTGISLLLIVLAAVVVLCVVIKKRRKPDAEEEPYYSYISENRVVEVSGTGAGVDMTRNQAYGTAAEAAMDADLVAAPVDAREGATRVHTAESVEDDANSNEEG